MSEPVRARRVAVVVGVLVALYVIVTFTIRTVPDGVVSLLGGPDGGVERVGGLRVSYRPAPGSEQALAHYLAHRANVQRQDGVLLLELPGLTEDMVPDVLDLLVAGGLQMKEVLETDYASEIGETADVKLEIDQWQADDGGPRHTNAFLQAPELGAIERAVAAAEARGWRLPAGRELAFEWVEPDRSARDPRPYWRSYELASEVLIDGTMIASASGAYDPYTNRPIVLLDLTRVGAERFCAITERLTGKKLATVLGGRIRSAPIIMGQICGGRASITMAAGDPATQERERDALVAVLQQGAVPAGGEIEQQRWTPPADVARQEWAGRLLLGLGAGLLVGLLVFVVLRFARPTTQLVATPADGRFPVRRLLVTLLAPLALVLGAYVDLPGVNMVEFAHLVGRVPAAETSVVALGVTPILVGFFLVELVALAVPRLRWRRHDPLGRVRLGQAVAVVAVGCAIVQGYFAAVAFEGIGGGGMFGGPLTGGGLVGLFDAGGGGLVAPGWSFRLIVIGSLVAGTLLLAIVAGMIREHGLGNGYAALIASGAVIEVVGPYISQPAALPQVLTRGHALGAITALAIVLGTACVLRWRTRAAAREPALRLPTPGISPLGDAAALLYLIMMLLVLTFELDLAQMMARIVELGARPSVVIGIVVVSTPLCAWLFARPSLVERVALQAGLERPTWTSWRRATLVSGLLLVVTSVLAAGAVLTDGQAAILAQPIALMIATAAVLDIVGDARAHRRSLVPAGVVHQVQYLGVIEQVLIDAGIPHHFHASNIRTLLAFFGPWAPVIVLVPAEHGEAARTRLDDVLRTSRARVPAARVTAGSPRDVA